MIMGVADVYPSLIDSLLVKGYDVFAHLRQLFAGLPEAKERKLTSKHF
ncbi:hypothetical protein M3650_26580 [Paenibacillus sp. MER TA 81-3]|nr:hypothetical protein [Paenibacillus sp. MER TA 81-3]MCM3342094.1 hypothetical protein [Paenibacillus sp. MER TA 81-3]